ncbi:unnamed protein product [Durusdinium trenchii]|uniref:Integrase zinc-binding domain-containing protein n=1 Tax=Durusdinium trenchii TaxID=1381693 RepID=A0ABP0IHJ6_9DINO
MEKGLMPLAALDVIRGWLVLEMAVSSEEDRRLIKAATRNRLAYSEIRTALLGLFEAGGGHGGHRHQASHRAYFQDYDPDETYDKNAEHYGFYTDESYGQDYNLDEYGEWPEEDNFEANEWENEEEFDEELLRLQQEQEEIEKNKSELEALLGETDRNLVEARKAVAAAHKDRGWSGTVQQKQPRSTSTYPWKGKSKGKGKSNGSFRPAPHDGHWIQGGKGGKGRSSFGSYGSFKGKGKKGKGKGSYGSNFNMGMMEVAGDLDDDEGMFPLLMAATPEAKMPREAKLPPYQSLVDTGATASAGGKQAVQDLCKSLVAVRPNLEVTVIETARPWFRFGNGRCGRALYKDEIRKAVREVVQEEISQATKQAKEEIKSTAAKAKGKAKVKTELDYTRKAGMDQRDPRSKDQQWPCYGNHHPHSHGNRFGSWSECGVCGLRAQYIPATNAPAQTTHVDLPQNVTLALERLRNEGWEPQNISSTQVKAMITIVAKEYQLIKTPKAKKGYTKPNDLPHAPSTASGSTPNPEIFPIGSDSEFEKVSVADGKKKREKDPMVHEAKEQCPSIAWFSLVCTAVTSIQNLNQRDWKQVDNLRKKRQRCRRQLRGAIAIVCAIIMASGNTSKFFFEWPKWATAGWRLPELQNFIKQYNQEFGRLYFTQIDGCMHGMKSPDGYHIQKSWLILHNDPEFHDKCGNKCDGLHQHRPGGMIGMGSKAVAETAFYPPSMVTAIARIWRSQCHRSRQASPKEIYKTIMAIDADKELEKRETKGEQELKHVPKEEIEKTNAMLHRLHRAAGHPTNRSLARLCQDRGLPPWVSQLALNLRCQACVDTKKGAQMTLPASIESRTRPWQMIGLDVFELYYPKLKVKARYLLMTCLTMRFTSVHLLWQGDMATTGTDAGAWHLENDPLEVNVNHGMSTAEFWQVQKNREAVEQIHRKELAASRMTRLYNASSRPTNAYMVVDWVCVWNPSSILNETFYQINHVLKENLILEKVICNLHLMNGMGLQKNRSQDLVRDHDPESHQNKDDNEYKNTWPNGISFNPSTRPVVLKDYLR